MSNLVDPVFVDTVLIQGRGVHMASKRISYRLDAIADKVETPRPVGRPTRHDYRTAGLSEATVLDLLTALDDDTAQCTQATPCTCASRLHDLAVLVGKQP